MGITGRTVDPTKCRGSQSSKVNPILMVTCQPSPDRAGLDQKSRSSEAMERAVAGLPHRIPDPGGTQPVLFLGKGIAAPPIMAIVREIMSPGTETISHRDSVFEAARRMRDNGIGMLPVEQDDKMVGTVTDRDLALGLADGLLREDRSVQDIMSSGVHWCYDDQTLEQAAEVMGEARIRRLPVVNRDKRLVGSLGLKDLVDSGRTEDAARILHSVLR